MLRLRAGALLVEASAAAREHLAMRPGFEVVDGRLLPREASARSAWLFAIRAVLQEGEPRLHWMPAGREAEAIALVPLPEETLFVRFERPLIAEWRTIRSFACECGLTRAEERVVVALCTGLSPRAIALRNGIGEATVRSQIKGALEKAGSGGPAVRRPSTGRTPAGPRQDDPGCPLRASVRPIRLRVAPLVPCRRHDPRNAGRARGRHAAGAANG